MRIKIPLLVILGILLAVNIVYAQDDCSEKLKQAEKFYEEGKIEKIPLELEKCLENGFEGEKLKDAYGLLIQALLFNDDYPKADSLMNLFLYQEPELVVDTPAYTLEFLNLYKTYQTKPVLNLNFYAGTNLTFVNQINNLSVTNFSPMPDLSSGVGFQAGLKASRYLTDWLEVFLEANYMASSFKYYEKMFEFTELNAKEKHGQINIPVGFIYKPIRIKKVEPVIELGINNGLNIKTTLVPERIYPNTPINDVKKTNIDFKDYRKTYNFSIIGGLGVLYKIEGAYLSFNLRYQKSLFNQAISEERYNKQDIIFRYFYLDDDFYIDNFFISVGYTHLIYRPKKITIDDKIE